MRRHLIIGGILLLIMTLVLLLLWQTGTLNLLMDSKRLRVVIGNAGMMGPFLIIGLMAMAIVFNPLPSAPLALAAGFAYGHTWGTLYVVIGSVAGAMIAFTIARLLGHDILVRWFGDRLKVGLLGSQNALTAMVLVFWLLPFISFDIVSYAAGLTEIRVWRFFLATVVGIIPASFLLAHFGSEMSTGDPTRISVTVLLLGLITAVPFAVKLILNRRSGRGEGGSGDAD